LIQIVLLRTDGKTVWHEHPVGFPTGLCVNNIVEIYQNNGAIIESVRKKDPSNVKNLFYCTGHHSGLGGDKPARTKLSFEYRTILPFDIDHVDQARAWDYLPIVAKTLNVAPQSLVFISTGNGLHIIGHLKTPIRSSKYIDETKADYSEVVHRINLAMNEVGLPGDADPSVWDAPRILRMPNSINEKLDKKTGKMLIKECVILQNPGLVPLDLDIVKLSGLDKVAQENVLPAQIRRNYPRPDFQHVMAGCEFMKWLVAHPEEVHEPQFMAALGLLSAMSPGDKFEEKTAKEVAEGVFNAACNSQSLARGDFEKKWDHGTRYGAAKCSTVSAAWGEGCATCEYHAKVNTPLAIKSVEHISSSENGYWVLGKQGPLHPHYSDLAKIYRQEHAYVTCEPDRLFTFQDTHYRRTGQLTIKSWVEKKVGYEEHLREAHCVEFVKKVMRSNALTDEQEKDIFEDTIRGKLNCRNGVVDIIKGELLPHSPTLGFKYCLPYDYEPGVASEIFLDWLAEMMQNRTELMDAVLDIMAYCLWPEYDDHMFAYFIGEGANGKGTLMHILRGLVGAANFSSVSLSQLSGNRFSPASLEGKLVNISEESSGVDLSPSECNIVKDLSAGGIIEVERKGEHPFDLTNRAKLIFSANKPPRFHEHGRALRRRLLVVPFDYSIQVPDKGVEDRLSADTPKILSMLVSRTQENISANGGHFVVSRGGQAGVQAQEKVLLSGDSVVEFASSCLESGLSVPEETYVSCKEAYDKYKVWCGENNYRATNSKQFGHMMVHGALSPVVDNSKPKRIGGKVVRIYSRTRWKDEE